MVMRGDQAMRTIGLLGAAALMTATIGAAWGQSPQTLDSSQVTTAPALPGGPQQGIGQSHPLFNIGKLEVHIWAPIEPYYDANMNHTAAANQFWSSAE
jgi:hypothetical protein